jgi:ribosomal protein S18
VYFPLLVDYLVSKTKIEHKRITGTKAGKDKDRLAVKAQVEAYAQAREENKKR